MNKGVYVALLSIGLAQGLKIPIHYVKEKEWRPELFFKLVECQVRILQEYPL